MVEPALSDLSDTARGFAEWCVGASATERHFALSNYNWDSGSGVAIWIASLPLSFILPLVEARVIALDIDANLDDLHRIVGTTPKRGGGLASRIARLIERVSRAFRRSSARGEHA
jgi:hypothetical protein